MTSSALPHLPRARKNKTMFLPLLAVCVLAWLLLVLFVGRAGLFHAEAGEPPLPTLAAIAIPPSIFLAFLRYRPFRNFILSVSPVWLAAVQGLRILGVGFLFVYAYDHLSGIFAHPAGWGDLLVALFAPFMATRLAQDPHFIRSAALWRFHALGMLDFAGAVGSGLLARAMAPMEAPTEALSQFPLLLIPCFAVPLWICLHLAAFAQIRAARESASVQKVVSSASAAGLR